jgi:hypothetical protein
MNDVYNYILIRDLKKLPKHGQAGDIEKAFKGGLNSLELGKNLQILDESQKTAEKLIKSLSTLEARALGIQRGFNLTTKEAKEYSIALDKVAVAQGINGRLAKQYIADLGKVLPGQIANIKANKAYNTELQVTNDVLRNKLKLDAKQSFSIRKFANAQGKSVAQIIKAANEVNNKLIEEEGYAGGLYDILAEIGNLNNNIAIQYGQGIPEQLERSVIAAKKFGLTLDDLYKSGEKMLDIEQMTTKAVEFQIFTGKKLEGQKYKNIAASYNQATIEGDNLKQQDILLDLVRSQGKILTGANFKAKQALADSVGLTVEQLQEIYTRDIEYAKISTDALARIEDESDEAFEKRKKQYKEERKRKIDEDLEKQKQELADVQAIGKERSTQTTLEKYEDQREIVKDKKVMDFASREKDLTPEELLEGGKKVIDLISKGLETVSIATKIANLYGTFTFTTDALKGLATSLIKVGGAYDDEDTSGGSNTTVENQRDAFIRVNDAIMFDPNDKINIMASTSQGSLDKATANMGGGSSNNTSNIGQQVANAIAGMSFVVNNSFNGEDIITQMEIIQENQMNA